MTIDSKGMRASPDNISNYAKNEGRPLALNPVVTESEGKVSFMQEDKNSDYLINEEIPEQSEYESVNAEENIESLQKLVDGARSRQI